MSTTCRSHTANWWHWATCSACASRACCRSRSEIHMELGTLSPALILTLVIGLALAPYVAVMITAFTKLVVVFSLLRNALGLQQTPPNLVLNGLAIILSIYVMYPVGLEMADAARPLAAQATQSGQQIAVADLLGAAERAKAPLQGFLVKHTSAEEREFFLDTARRMLPESKRAATTA